MHYREFIENGYPCFGLYPINDDGSCGCHNPKCNAAGKHPMASNWQHTPLFDDEQIEVGEMLGQFDVGYGVLCNGLIVIDIDERNGGADSYASLIEKCPKISESGLIVKTGSGGASRHIYFKAPENVQLNQHLNDYKGIDFKSNGFVVGPGSIHKSGNRYEIVYGSVDDIELAPESLINLLKKPERHKTVLDGEHYEISDLELMDILSHIDPDCDHETWVKCGMAIHHVTGGGGFEIWNGWSAKGSKYPGADTLQTRWHSFGKSSNPVTIGTLIHYAKEAGWSEDVTFQSDIEWEDEDIEEVVPHREKPDLANPPGLVGRIAKWINAKSRYPRPNLAVAAALMTVSACGGMRYRCEMDETVPNLFMFCVAGSGTGKEAVLQSHIALLRRTGIAPAVHGGIKSEQEIIRNILRHQAALYTIDELGEVLSKIAGARKKSGSSPYLEGVIKALMEIFSKSNGYVTVNGDLKEEVKNNLRNEYKAVEKAVQNNEYKEGGRERMEALKQSIDDIDNGIKDPFLNVFGFTTPERFYQLFDEDMAASGFFGRAIIVREHDDNPREQPKTPRHELDIEEEAIAMRLSQIYGGGNSKRGRVERIGDIEHIRSTPKATVLMDGIKEYFWEMAETQKERTGLVPFPRRGYELVSRVSTILAIGEGIRTDEHVAWAFELVKNDIDAKLMLTNANTSHDKGDALVSKIIAHLDHDHGVSMKVLFSKIRSEKRENIEKAIAHMIEQNMIEAREIKPIRGASTVKYFKAEK